MSDNGAGFFNAPKGNRQDAFHFNNDTNADPSGNAPGPLAAEISGDQSSRVYPLPAVLGTAQKVKNPILEPAPENPVLEVASGRMDYDSIAYYDRYSGTDNV